MINKQLPSLYNDRGRKYIDRNERQALLACAARAAADVRTFTETLVYTGCRISEALNLTVGNIDLDQHTVQIETLKQRTRGIWRAVPVQKVLIEHLDLAHGLRRRQHFKRYNERLWTYSRSTGWRHISRLLHEADIRGPQANPKGLRHGFGVAAIEARVPLHIVARWLGHSNTQTTEIYTQAVAIEERKIAARMFVDTIP